MTDYIVIFQLFSIGFIFGISGPCMLSCMPVIFLYFSNQKSSFWQSLINISPLLLGRLSAYCFLGFLAGFSAQILNSFLESMHFSYFSYLGGGVLIVLGGYLWFGRWESENDKCLASKFSKKKMNHFLFFVLGIAIGLSPCPPLIALFLEIVMLSKTPYQGMLYALFFGLGTLVSGLLILVPFGKFAHWLPHKLMGKKANMTIIYQKGCSLLLIALGFWMIGNS